MGLAAMGLPLWYAREALAFDQEVAFARAKKIGPNDKIQVGVIGSGDRFKGGLLGDVARFKKDFQIVACCDVDKKHRDGVAKAVQKEFGSLDAYLWQFVGGKPIVNRRRSMKDISPRTPESDAMSKDLLRRGFKFVGSTICYALMQAVGMVNDHLVTCPRHAEVG